MHLFTHHGTIIYYDSQAGELRHGPIEQDTQRAILVTCGSRHTESDGAILTFVDGPAVGMANCRHDRSTIAGEPILATEFQFVLSTRDTIYLRSGSLYLCAEEDGRVTLSRDRPNVWERFTIAYIKDRYSSHLHLIAKEFAFVIRTVRNKFCFDNHTFISRINGSGKRAIICSLKWLQTYLIAEHVDLINILHEDYGFDIIEASETDFYSDFTLEELNKYDSILIAYQQFAAIPVNKLTNYVVMRIDDLENYNDTYTSLIRFFALHCDMLISPYAYEIARYFPHQNIKWIPYTSAIEERCGVLPLNTQPIEKVLASGSLGWDRPFRTFVFGLDDDRIAKLAHPGYGWQFDNNTEAIVKDKWFLELHRYICGFCDAHSLKYIHLRVFEIASVGSLLLADRLVEPEMNQLGFVDGETCIFCDQVDFLEKVSWVLDRSNRNEVDRIRAAGMKMCLERHTTRLRAAEFVEMLEAELHSCT